jgi:hypothetical protein
MGVTEIDHYLAILGLSDQMDLETRTKVATGILQGMESKV